MVDHEAIEASFIKLNLSKFISFFRFSLRTNYQVLSLLQLFNRLKGARLSAPSTILSYEQENEFTVYSALWLSVNASTIENFIGVAHHSVEGIVDFINTFFSGYLTRPTENSRLMLNRLKLDTKIQLWPIEFKMVTRERIELSTPTPKVGVLPLYYRMIYILHHISEMSSKKIIIIFSILIRF